MHCDARRKLSASKRNVMDPFFFPFLSFAWNNKYLGRNVSNNYHSITKPKRRPVNSVSQVYKER